MIVPIIVGSDKTTVSAATGNAEYHPGCFSIGWTSNAASRAYRNTVIFFAFLSIVKGGFYLNPFFS
jgi:hypothetical protein